MADSAAEIQKHVRTYLIVFVALAGLTVLTVGVSFIHFGTTGNIVVALIIATVKATLVATVFMHLISEKQFIYGVLSLTAFFFLVLMFIPRLVNDDSTRTEWHPPTPIVETHTVDHVS